MGQQIQQNVVDFLLDPIEIYGALYLFYIALWLKLNSENWKTKKNKDWLDCHLVSKKKLTNKIFLMKSGGNSYGVCWKGSGKRLEKLGQIFTFLFSAKDSAVCPSDYNPTYCWNTSGCFDNTRDATIYWSLLKEGNFVSSKKYAFLVEYNFHWVLKFYFHKPFF